MYFSFLPMMIMPSCTWKFYYMISRLHKNIYKIVNGQNITVVHSEKNDTYFLKNSSVNLFLVSF